MRTFLLAPIFLLLVCCSPRVVEIERPVVVESVHTQHHTDIIHDTLIYRDSVYHFVAGDTCIIERYHHTERIERVGITDTLRDTIPRIVTKTVTQVREVSRLRWWHYLIFSAITIGFIFIIIRRK